MTVYLGIDYGEKHLGLAVADGPLARPLLSLDLSPEQALPRITFLAAREAVGTIVIGLPEGPLKKKITAFGERLSKLASLPVVYHEETLSTQEALAGLRAGGASKAKLSQDHKYAACLILEDYLETHHEVGYTKT